MALYNIMALYVARKIARLKLKAMGMNLEILTEEQEKYLASWDMGT